MIGDFIDYEKLEKLEVGGLMGRLYSPVIERVNIRFTKFMERMSAISYDPLDLLNESYNTLFLEDYKFYLEMSNDIDNRLSTVSKACFDNSEDLMSLHKVNYLLYLGVGMCDIYFPNIKKIFVINEYLLYYIIL